jgi:hypothetical protein
VRNSEALAMNFDSMFRSYLALGRLGHAATMMSLAAAEVMFARTVMMAQGGMSGPEAARMWMEKPAAFAQSAQKAAMAAARGGDAVTVATAALRPIRHSASANARRLRK